MQDPDQGVLREGDRIDHEEHGELTIKSFTESVVGIGPKGPERKVTVRFTPSSAFGSFEPFEQTEQWDDFKDGVIEVIERAE